MIPIDENELKELLKSSDDPVIWERRVYTLKFIVKLLVQLGVVAYFLYYIEIFQALISLFFIIPYLLIATLATTMKYSILPDKIIFNWGLFGRKEVEIPFEDIQSIDLVKYNDTELSTIHFGTKSSYKLRRVSFMDGGSRPHITFENVPDGDKVIELLKFLWNRKKEGLELEKIKKIKQDRRN